MTPDDVRAAADQLVRFHDRFAPIFGKEQAQDHAYDYLKGLMTCPERKSIEPIALTVGHGDVSGLQKFINSAPWQADDLQDEIQDAFADELVPSAARSPIGVVGVLDESCFAKKGRHSVGVARQHNGRLGKEDNCQVGVFLIGVTPDGVALLGHQLYLHQSWYDGPEGRRRREAAHVPEGLPFRTKPQIAAELVRSVAVHDVGAPGLGHRRRGVRHQRRAARRARGAGPAVRHGGPEGQHGLGRGPGRLRARLLGPRPAAEATDARGGALGGRGRRRVAGRGVASAPGARGGGRARWSSSSRRCGSGRSATAGPARRSGC